MRRARPSSVVILLVLLLALLAVTASTALLMRPAVAVEELALARAVPEVSASDPASRQRGLHLMLLPHPDDELSAWTTLLDDPALHVVMVLLTQGEATQRCSADALDKHLQDQLGEAAPRPDPSVEGAASDACREARLNAFRENLTEAASHTPVMRVDWPGSTSGPLGGTPAQIARGEAATVIMLDLGDGLLSASSVEEVVHALLADPSTGLPDLPLARVTASAYYALETDGDSGAPCAVASTCPAGEHAYVYDRPDHLAVRDAARALAPLTGLLRLASPHVQACTTCLFLKGRAAEAELTHARECWQMCAAEEPSLSDPEGRVLIISEIQRAPD